MGLTTALARLARGSPARCLPIVGRGAEEAARWLRLDPALQVVDSPRSADVLLVMGSFDAAGQNAIAAVHDAMAPPRGVVAWSPGGDARRLLPSTDVVTVADPTEVASAAVRLRDQLLSGRRTSTPDIRPDVEPAPWRGIGPFGQGGTGMTGGVPYGRPMAGRADDRDGLKLDQILIRAGPFLPPFPSGLQLDVRIQGDVVQEVGSPVVMGSSLGAPPQPDSDLALFRTAVTRPTRVRDLELARARHHLVWLSGFLRTCGLGAFGLRVLRCAMSMSVERADELEGITRWLDRNVSLRWPSRGVGALSKEQVGRLPGGPVARAAGVVADARSLDPTYGRLGFAPVVATGSDAFARWRLRLEEARRSLALAARAQEARTTPLGIVEGPCGPVGSGRSACAVLIEMLPELLIGQEWGDAVTTVVSLDIDLAYAGSADEYGTGRTGAP